MTTADRPADAGTTEGPISPSVRALEALIEASLEDLTQSERRLANEALLFIGNWNDALPRLLIHDPVLEPVDKIIWAVIKTCTDPRRGTAFPNYATIARLANVSAEGTVTRALAILRVTRWLTLCGRARDHRGRFRGSVYALHDEPLSLPDTLHLDPTYMDFTGRSTSHAHARVSRVASAVMRSLELDAAENRDLEVPQDPIAARVEAQQLVHDRENGPAANPNSRKRRAIFSRSFATRAELLPEPTHPELDSDQPQNLGSALPRLLQNLRAVPQLQNLDPQNLRSCSSSNKEKTTTTTTAGGVVDDAASALSLYRWPAWLTANARHLAVVELRRAPAPLRQTVLDLLDQRRRDGEAAVAERLHHPIQYLRSLCQLAAAGKIAQREEPKAPPGDLELKQRLLAAESDYRHWLRLIELANDPKRKAQWQAEVNRAKNEVARCKAALDAANQASRAP